jgi:hypothetical protein
MSTARISSRIAVFKAAHGVWRRRGEAASAALYSVYNGLYSEAVVSSVASAVALAEVGQFKEAVQYVQKAAKALYEAAKDVFEHVKITVQRLVELFVEAVTRVLAWIDEHKAYLFLMAAVAAGAVALATALNIWGLIELDKLAYAASLTPFIPAGVKEYSREEAFKVLRSAPDPYERFKEVAKAAIAKNEKLPQPWESLRVLIMPKQSEEEKLMSGCRVVFQVPRRRELQTRPLLRNSRAGGGVWRLQVCVEKIRRDGAEGGGGRGAVLGELCMWRTSKKQNSWPRRRARPSKRRWTSSGSG